MEQHSGDEAEATPEELWDARSLGLTVEQLRVSRRERAEAKKREIERLRKEIEDARGTPREGKGHYSGR
jgi:hypothetical protein